MFPGMTVTTSELQVRARSLLRTSHSYIWQRLRYHSTEARFVLSSCA